MSKQKKKQSAAKWILTIFVVTILISAVFSFFSNLILESAALIITLLVLLVIIFIGILFDIVGVAVASVDAESIHGMAARRIKGAAEASYLIKHASKVSSICCDVIGDICGVVSGSATAMIAARLLLELKTTGDLSITWVPLILSALVAGLTVGGKAVGKIIAMENATQILFNTGRLMAFFKSPFRKHAGRSTSQNVGKKHSKKKNK